MRKLGKAVLLFVLAGLLSVILGGCGLSKLLVVDRVVDGDGMINTNAPLMEALDGGFTSADGRWSAEIDGYSISIRLDGECVYDGKMYFSFDGDDTNVRTDLNLYADNSLGSVGNDNVTIKQLYSENGMLCIDAAYGGGASETVSLEKEEEQPMMLDGAGSYVDNDPLLAVLQGSRANDGGTWRIEISDYEITVLRDDESVYCDSFSFVFLSETDVNAPTELVPESFELCGAGGGCFASIYSLCSKDGVLDMRIDYADGSSENIIFQKTAK